MWIPIYTMQKPFGTKYSPINIYKERYEIKMHSDQYELEQFKEKLGKAVREQRMKQQLSIDDVADRSKTCKSYIWSVENGLANPTISKMDKIARALGTDVSSLLV